MASLWVITRSDGGVKQRELSEDPVSVRRIQGEARVHRVGPMSQSWGESGVWAGGSSA